MNIAIVGASANREKFGNKCVRAYVQKGWKVFPVNLKEKEIEGLPVYSSVLGIKERIDRISIYLPPAVTLSLVPELKKANAREIFLNPGAESEELIQALQRNHLKPILKCSIRNIGVDPNTL